MEYKDYYKILGVKKNATAAQIKKEYRKMARKYHPDVNKNSDAEQKFKEVGEAYEVLKDPEKRKLYDQYGADWKTGKQQQEYQQQQQQNYRQQGSQQQGGGFGGGFDFGGGFEGGGDYSDFFESIFGGGGRKQGRSSRQSMKQKGEDVNASITVPIEDAFKDSTRRINFELQSASPDGQMQRKPVSLNVKIPKGIKNGQKIRLAGQGSPGYNGGAKGDMFLTVEFEKHPFLKVEGSDIYINLPVSPWEAALGNTVSVPAPSENIKLKVPAGSAQGKKLRLKGKGIPSKVPGDLYVILNITLPPADSDKARKVYEEMKDLNFNPRANFER